MNIYMQHVRGTKRNFLFTLAFRPMSWLNALAVSVLDFLRSHGLLKTQEPPLPVISVGNLTYGGTNKTPFVEMLAKFAGEYGVKAGIVTRGYSGRTQNVTLIRDGKGDRELTGDEPLMLSRSLPNVPVAIARHRLDGVNALRKAGAELVIADDAFQHRALGRDADIVLIDSMCPFGSCRLIPDGIMREGISALSRADIVVLTKSEQASPENLASLRALISEYVSPERIFTSRLDHDGWILHGTEVQPESGAKVFAFSAIGNPESFEYVLKAEGFKITGHRNFRDHHRYSARDIEEMGKLALARKSDFMACTEKDLYNLPPLNSLRFPLPLVIPKVKTAVNEPEEFFAALTECLRPKIIVASNGYGEDAIGVMLAQKLREKLPASEISAFPLVGKGEAYLQAGFAVKSAPSVTPSGGVLKYSLKDLVGDMRAGLLKHVRAQLSDWRKIARRVRTPMCVGDVYLLLHALWGAGARPMFCATAKTVYLSGHWRIERALIDRFTLLTWTRDAKSAEQLGRRAVYAGSPIMDLLGTHRYVKGEVILLLPGSRLRACKDVKMLLEAAEILSGHGERKFRMVLAPTLPDGEFLEACESYGWGANGGRLERGDLRIELTREGIACATEGVKLLIGLGGTANQLCAGLGIPVVSIDEKGKRVQKKLLGESELLVEGSGRALAECALRVLGDEELYGRMSVAGRERMGGAGACESMSEYACEVLGWRVRERVYLRFDGRIDHRD